MPLHRCGVPERVLRKVVVPLDAKSVLHRTCTSRLPSGITRSLGIYFSSGTSAIPLLSPKMAEFTSRMCDVCDTALRLAFASLKDRTPEISDEVAHHATKDSLVDSILRKSCHLCRLLIYFLKNYSDLDHYTGLEEEQPMPPSFSEDDFKDSDFEFVAFPRDRVGIRSYMQGLPEDVGLRLQMEEFSDGADGVLGTMKFDCDTFAKAAMKTNLPRFWIFGSQGM
jgi:hypothetical protein